MMQGRIIRPGSKTMVPIRELHSDAETFGQNVNQFDPDRFVGDNLDKSLNFRQVGGGVTVCPGCFLAKGLSLIFVAMMLERFEIQSVKKSGVAKAAQGLRAPEIDYVSPSVGASERPGNMYQISRAKEMLDDSQSPWFNERRRV